MCSRRARQLVPLHAAMIGLNGRGLLLMGDSGAGKSTLALHCLLRGMELLSEDSVSVAPANLRAAGIAKR
jgi:serine kinase of HPr protein (carbohydrate metabolism regulator)